MRKPIVLNPNTVPPVMDQSRHHQLVIGVRRRQRYIVECTRPARSVHIEHKAVLPDGTVLTWYDPAPVDG